MKRSSNQMNKIIEKLLAEPNIKEAERLMILPPGMFALCASEEFGFCFIPCPCL